MLAEAWRWPPDGDARAVRDGERAGVAKGTAAGVLDVDEEAAGGELRRACDLARRVDRRQHEAPLARGPVELGRGLRREERAEFPGEEVDVLLRQQVVIVALPVDGLETRRRHPVLVHVRHHGDQARNARRSAAERVRHVPVATRPDLALDRPARVHEGADAAAALAGHPEHRRGADARHHHRRLERDVDVLALATLVAGKQREEHADGSLEAAVVVRDGQGATDRGAVGVARRIEVAARRDDGEVRAAPCGARAGLSERRDRAEDRTAVPRVQRLPAEAARREAAGRLRLEDDVSPLGECEEQLASARPVERERHAALGGVEREPEERPLHVGGPTPERRPPPRRIAPGRLDLHDVGAEVAEHLPREEPGLRSEVEDANAGQVSVALRHGPVS